MQPLIEKLPECGSTPVLFEALDAGCASYFLDSGMDHRRLGRYSFIGSDPFLLFSSHGDRCCIQESGRTYWVKRDPFRMIRELMKPYLLSHGAPVPMAGGGAVGYFSYDLGRLLEQIPRRAFDDLGLPECCLAFYDGGIIIDHLNDTTYLTATGLPFTGKEGKKLARQRLKERLQRVSQAAASREECGSRLVQRCGSDLQAHFTRERYCRAVEQVLAYIAAGDIYQVNLTQRFSAKLETGPWELYRRLRRINPAPFAGYLRFPIVTIAGSSPERFLLVEGDRVETRPIKGTRPRGQNEAEDRALRDELLHSEKDRAELVMIIDLERNDLGRVCQTGSIAVPELFTLETYATVYHLVSTVTGRLPAGKDIFDLIPAAFPGGSITGAPKVRAMEIIEELEPVRRGIYTGSFGYIDFHGRADLNIVIRTFIVKNGRAYFQAGGGIVADSNPEAEYRETLDKVGALLAALGIKGEL